MEDSDSFDVESVDTSDPEPIEKPYEVSVQCSHGMAGGLGQPTETVPADYEAYGRIVHWVTKEQHMEYVEDGSDISVTVSDVTVKLDHRTESTYISDCDREVFEQLVESVL